MAPSTNTVRTRHEVPGTGPGMTCVGVARTPIRKGHLRSGTHPMNRMDRPGEPPPRRRNGAARYPPDFGTINGMILSDFEISGMQSAA